MAGTADAINNLVENEENPVKSVTERISDAIDQSRDEDPDSVFLKPPEPETEPVPQEVLDQMFGPKNPELDDEKEGLFITIGPPKIRRENDPSKFEDDSVPTKLRNLKKRGIFIGWRHKF